MLHVQRNIVSLLLNAIPSTRLFFFNRVTFKFIFASAILKFFLLRVIQWLFSVCV